MRRVVVKKLRQRCFLVSLPNISEQVFVKPVWAVTASAKYRKVSLLRRPHQQNATLNLGYVQLSLEVLDNYLIYLYIRDTSKMLLEIRSSRPAVFFKNFVLQNLQVSQESICDEVFFRKAVSPYSCNCIKKVRHRRFPVNILIWIYLLIVSFQSKPLFLNRSDLRTDQQMNKERINKKNISENLTSEFMWYKNFRR